MKRTSILTLMIVLLLVNSCTKREQAKYDDTIATIYENKNVAAMRSRPFNPLRMDYTTKAERIGYNHGSLKSLKASPEFASIVNRFDLNLEDITRHYYDHNFMNTTFLPFRKSETKEVLIAYNVAEKYYFAIGKEVMLENGMRHIKFSSVNGSPFYEFKVSKANTVGEFQSHASPFETKIQESVLSVAPNEQFNPLDQIGKPKYGCCSYGFNDCLNCFSRSCSQEWQCGLMCSLTLVYCTAAWAGSCITKKGCNYPAFDVLPGTDPIDENDPITPLPIPDTLTVQPLQ